MPIFEINLPKTISKALGIPKKSPKEAQLRVLKKLLRRARYTAFGQKNKFEQIVLSRHPGKTFQQNVPTYNYNKIYNEWWYQTLDGKEDICWPGKIKYFALSSGTSESASKYIPITNDLLKGNKVIMIKQLLSLLTYQSTSLSSIGSGMLTLGGSTDLQKGPGYYAGDLSGITAKKSPFWFQPFYKPGKKIAKEKNWNKKLVDIVEKAPDWDIGFLAGVPAWIQMCLEMVIEKYKVKNIHEIWPNLTFFVHGGVSFEPYKIGFEKLLGKPITYVETYLASEGFLAWQDKQNAKGMRLSYNQHIFFEFVPFDENNFDADGEMVENPEALMIHEVEEGKDYALLISTNAGAWRYLIGDTVRFVDKENAEIIITGRTKHFLSIVGEHLSVDNMNKAIHLVSEEFNLSIPEYAVRGENVDSLFGHHWYVACDQEVDGVALAKAIDEKLIVLNDDYAIERKNTLKRIRVTVLKENIFMDFMQAKGKIGGQHKFPRVLKGDILKDWEIFIQNK
ncbi:MAG: GH3 auxin-responsive promoter family protein [Sediminibacterium sp.]|nr:GH3 auxin-responsive promoter family protein [Sediminibacterium sp.]